MLEAINSGKTLALAAGGIVNGSTFAPSNTYAPSLAINVPDQETGTITRLPTESPGPWTGR